MKPTDQQIGELITRARKILSDNNLERRVVSAMNRDRAGSPRADGYPRGTLSDGRGGGVDIVDPQTGEPCTVQLTPTEAAADQRVFARTYDPHRANTQRVVDKLLEAVDALGSMANTLDVIDRDSKPPAEQTAVEEREQDCESCSRHRSLAPRTAKHFSDVKGMLTRKWRLCGPCYHFVYGQGTAEGVLPTLDQLAEYDARGTWRVRAFEGGLSR